MSDLLVGDAWGMEKIFPQFMDKLGASAVLVLTEKGRYIFNEIKDSFSVRNIDSQEVIQSNPRIILPESRNALQKSFNKKLEKLDSNIHYWTEKYAKPTIFIRIKGKILRLKNKLLN